jgi:hypothetical protein
MAKKRKWEDVVKERQEMVKAKDVFVIKGNSAETRAMLNRIIRLDGCVRFIRNKLATPKFDTQKGLEFIGKFQEIIDQMNELISEGNQIIKETKSGRGNGETASVSTTDEEINDLSETGNADNAKTAEDLADSTGDNGSNGNAEAEPEKSEKPKKTKRGIFV